MKTEEIKAMQQRIANAGFKLGTIDGFWGPKSIAACQAYLCSLMPTKNPWPEENEKALKSFYGVPGDESKLVPVVFPYRMYYMGKLVTHSRCHFKVKDSLLRVLKEIGDRWAYNLGIMEEAEDYGGIYNNRNKRGGTTPSLHARGAAIDLDADDNGNKMKWPEQADMPLEIMEAFSREGWVSAGAFWLRDAMHFQATRPKVLVLK